MVHAPFLLSIQHFRKTISVRDKILTDEQSPMVALCVHYLVAQNLSKQDGYPLLPKRGPDGTLNFLLNFEFDFC